MTEENKPSAEELTTIQPVIDTNQAGASDRTPSASLTTGAAFPPA